MNIKMQICGMILLIVIFFFYSSARKVRLRTGRVFEGLFLTVFLSLVFDILSIVFLTYSDVLPELFVTAVCKIYLISVIALSYGAFHYVISDVYNEYKEYFHVRLGAEMALVIGSVAIIMLPIEKHIEDKENIYTAGYSVICTYLVAVTFIIATALFLQMKKKSIQRRRYEAVMIWLLIWVTAAAVQFCVNQVLIVGFATSIGIMVIYLKLENPEANMDKDWGLYNQSALQQYVRQLYSDHKDFGLMSVNFMNAFPYGLTEEEEHEAELDMAEYFNSIPHTVAFKTNEEEVAVVFLNIEEAEEEVKRIRNRFEFGWGQDGEVVVNPSWIFAPNAAFVNRSEDILKLMRYARQHESDFMQNDMVIVDGDIMNYMYDEQRVERMIIDAIENDRVEVFYQPIYSIAKGRFTAAEALVRIRDMDDHIIPPVIFVDIAENNGTIAQIGEIVFEKVCAFIETMQPQQYGLDYIEVNLSVVQCADPMLADTFIKIMERHHVEPSQINLEITESASLKAKDVLLDNMEKLRSYGVTFSLDDFGTGRSNLNYIVEMPVDIVKFDRQMILSYFADEKGKYVMDAAMHMIQGMGLPIVSEGIETEEMYDTMKKIGISYIQGYYFSKPLPGAGYLDYIARHHAEMMG
ncbi:MAG: EAL domain-containing protein [Lachnospiraceae bacterium]|nr:EAL domain-containing protein [Lachnospiraceae bacterium]